MESISAFESAGTRGFYRPSGCVSAGQLADLVTAALKLARATGLRDLLVNLDAMTGFEASRPAYCRWVARRWAETAGEVLRVAVVAGWEQVCPERIGPLVAAEEGLQAFICEREAEAIAWLDAATDAPPGPAEAGAGAIAWGRPHGRGSTPAAGSASETCEADLPTAPYPGQQSGVSRMW